MRPRSQARSRRCKNRLMGWTDRASDRVVTNPKRSDTAGWKDDPEDRALAQRAFNFQLGTVALGYMLDDGQAQPGAAGVARAAAIDPVKTLGQARQMFWRNAGSAVLHGKLSPVVRQQARSHGNFTPARRVTNGVTDQVAHGADQFIG